jgi:hypothetical protein
MFQITQRQGARWVEVAELARCDIQEYMEKAQSLLTAQEMNGNSEETADA